MPIPFEMDEEATARVRQWYAEMMTQENVSPTPLGDKVVDLEQRYQELGELTRQILASLALEGNQQYFSLMPEHWFDLLRAWTKRYHHIVGEEKDANTEPV